MTVSNQVADVSGQYLVEAAGQVVPAGYKQTEVGVIPNEWDWCKLIDAVQKVIDNRGKTPPIQRDGEYELIETASISFVGMSPDYSKVTKYVSRETFESWFRAHPTKGDILVSTVGEYSGATAILNQLRGTIAQNLIALRLKPPLVPEFVFYWTRSRSYKQQIEQVMMNQAQPSLRVPWLLSFKLPVPTKTEQTAIANALSDVDALIHLLEKLIAKKQAIKTATMQQLLTGRTRLSPFALHEDGTQKGYKQSELGDIPEDWEVRSLGEASQFINGRAYALHEWETQGTPVIRLQNLTGRGEDYYYSNLQLPEKQYCDSGDLLFMWSATFGPVIWKGQRAIYHYHIWKIECREGYVKPYFFYLLDDMTEKLKRGSSSGGTMLHVTKQKMEATKSVFPTLKEQTAIATILSDMDADIQTLQQRLSKTRQIKQGMMQVLLTGKIRLLKPAAQETQNAEN